MNTFNRKLPYLLLLALCAWLIIKNEYGAAFLMFLIGGILLFFAEDYLFGKNINMEIEPTAKRTPFEDLPPEIQKRISGGMLEHLGTLEVRLPCPGIGEMVQLLDIFQWNHRQLLATRTPKSSVPGFTYSLVTQFEDPKTTLITGNEHILPNRHLGDTTRYVQILRKFDLHTLFTTHAQNEALLRDRLKLKPGALPTHPAIIAQEMRKGHVLMFEHFRPLPFTKFSWACYGPGKSKYRAPLSQQDL